MLSVMGETNGTSIVTRNKFAVGCSKYRTKVAKHLYVIPVCVSFINRYLRQFAWHWIARSDIDRRQKSRHCGETLSRGIWHLSGFGSERLIDDESESDDKHDRPKMS